MFAFSGLRRAARCRNGRGWKFTDTLEDRLLLDGVLTSSSLTSTQQQHLQHGLQGLAAWTDTLSSFNKLWQPLSVADQSVGQAVAAYDVLSTRLVNPVVAAPGASTDGIVNALKGLSSSAQGLTVTVNPTSVTGGMLSTAQGDELQFNLVFDAVRTTRIGLNLGSNAAGRGLSLDPAFQATSNANLHFDFTFGLDLTPGLNASEAFFVRVNSLTLGEGIHEPNINTSAKVGLLGGVIQGGTLDMDGAVSVTLVNPDADVKGNITLAELQNTNISALAGMSTTANSLSGSLPIVAVLGSTTIGGSPTATISSTNIFAGAAPEIAGNAGFAEISNFNNISAANLLTVFDRVATGLQVLAPTLDVNTALGGLPYVNTQAGNVVDYNALVGRNSRGLYDPTITSQNHMSLAVGGRLTDDAIFSLRVNDTQTTSVILHSANQQVGETIVGFINRSLPPTLAGKISSSQITTAQGSFLSLKVIDPAITKLEILISDRANPITSDLGFEPSQTSVPVFKFDTVQNFVPILAQIMGVTPAQVNPQYDPGTHAFSFQTSFQGMNFSQTVPFDFSDGMGPLTFLTPSSGTFTSTPTASVRVGVELAGLQTVLTATGDALVDGKLATTAHFSVILNGASPVTVVVARDLTNSSSSDLVADLNASLKFSGLGGQVTAGLSGNNIMLTSPTGSTLRVDAAATDSAATQMFLPGNGVGEQWANHVYLASGAQLNIASNIVDSNISGAAALGILPVTVNPSAVTMTVNAAATLTTQTHLGDLRTNAVSILNVTTPAVTLRGHIELTVDPSAGITLGTPAAFDLGLTPLNQLVTTLTSSPPGPGNGQLGSDAHFSLTLGDGTPVNLTVPTDAVNVSLADLIADINTTISATRLRGSVVAGRSGDLITLSTFGLDSLAINSLAGDATQTRLHLANAVVTPAIGYVVNQSFHDHLVGVSEFGTDDFVTSVQGLLDLFATGRLNALTEKIPMLNQSVDSVLGVSQKLVNSIQQLSGQTGTPLKVVTQGNILSSFQSAISGLQLSLPPNSTDDLFAIYDALRTAAQNSGRTDVPRAADLAGTIVASITPLTQAIARLNKPGVNVAPLTDVLNLLKQATPSLSNLGTTLASILQLGSSGTVTTQIVDANPSSAEPTLLVHVNWLPNTTRDVSLGTLKMPNGLGPLKFASGSTVPMTINGDLKFDFGYNMAKGTPLLADSSHFNATASFGTPGTTYNATIGGVSVTLGHTGNPTIGDPANPVSFQLLHEANNPPAALVVSVTPTPDPTDLGLIPFATVANSLAYVSTAGHLQAKLPVYVAGNARGDILVDWDFPHPAPTDVVVTPPADLIPTLQSLPYNFDVFKDGIRDWNDQFERLLQNNILGSVPLVQPGVDVKGGVIGVLQHPFLAAVSNAITAHAGLDSSQFRTDLASDVTTALGTLLRGQTQVTLTGSPEVRFTVHGIDTYRSGLRIGLNALGLEITDLLAKPIDVSMTYNLQLGFGISKTAGFYFIVEPLAPQFTLDVSAVLNSTAHATTELFSLPVIATGNVGPGMQSLTRVDSMGLNISVLDPDGHMTSEQLDPQVFPLSFSRMVGAAGADVHIDLHLLANALDPQHPNETLPGIATDLKVDQHFAPGVALTGGAIPRVKLDNIGLDIGSALSKMVQPIIRNTNSFLAPIAPVVRALNETVPVLSRFSKGATWLDLISLYEPSQKENVDSAKKLVSILDSLDLLGQKAQSLSSSTTVVNFGYYQFNPSYDLRQGDSASPKPIDPSNPSVGVFHASFAATNDGTISPLVLNVVGSTISSFLTDDLQASNVRFPIFEDASKSLGLLFGNDATLITWQLPEFKVGANVYDQYLGTYPVGPIPVSVYLGLYLGVSFNVGIGLDTRGLAADHSFEDGFFFIDSGRSGPPVIDFRTGLSVTGSGGIPYIGEAGVKGTVFADILAHWKDDDRDGKVHLDELLTNLDQGPECVFDLTGRLSFQLALHAVAFGIPVNLPVTPEITLFEFDNDCPPLPPPELAHVSDGSDLDYAGSEIPTGTLVLNIGPYAGLRQPGVSTDSSERLHVYEFAPGIITVSGFGQTRKYGDAASPIRVVYGDAGLGENTLLFDASVMASTTLLGGPGKDTIRGGSGRNYILGRGGNDTLIGGVDNDHIESGVGDARIYGLAGTDSIFAQGDCVLSHYPNRTFAR